MADMPRYSSIMCRQISRSDISSPLQVNWRHQERRLRRAAWPALRILAIMPELIPQPSRVAAAGQPPKQIDEYVGRANTSQDILSIAHMRSPSGWAEPGQRPEFDEFTIVLRGALVVESEGGQLTVTAGQGVHARPGEWVRYSTPGADGAEYISVCMPAFAPGTVHRGE
jgi:mannose-6-phosphate isomerase-like protein (cupin superfamily)